MFKNSEPPNRRLTVLYDSRCGFCVAARRWLETQPTYFPLEFIPAGTAAARRRACGRTWHKDELVAIADDGRVYRDGHAWILCLYALVRCRDWALRLSTSHLFPFARQAFAAFSKRRRGFSRLLGLSSEIDLARELERMPGASCDDPDVASTRLSQGSKQSSERSDP